MEDNQEFAPDERIPRLVIEQWYNIYPFDLDNVADGAVGCMDGPFPDRKVADDAAKPGRVSRLMFMRWSPEIGRWD